jgi:hypothetical protein
MSNYTIDILIIIFFKLIILLGFVFLLKFWLKKTNKIIPIIIYWVLGTFLVFVFTTDILRFLLVLTIYNNDSLLTDMSSLGSLSSLLGLTIYIFVGLKYFKRKKQFS